MEYQQIKCGNFSRYDMYFLNIGTLKLFLYVKENRRQIFKKMSESIKHFILNAEFYSIILK